MSANSLFILQSGLTQAGPASALTAGRGASQGAVQGTMQGADFMALVLSRLGQGLPLQTTKTGAAPGAGSMDFLKTPESLLPAESGNVFGADAALLETLSMNREAIDSVLAPLTGGIITTAEISNGSPRILKALLIDTGNPDPNIGQKISRLKDELQKLMENGDPVAISVNLTPEQITALENAGNGEWPEELNGIMIGLVTFAPPPRAANAAAPEAGQGAPSIQTAKQAPGQISGQSPATAPGSGTATGEQPADFETALQDLQTGGYRKNSELAAPGGGATNTASAGADKAASGAATAAAFSGGALQNWPFSPESGLYAAPGTGYADDPAGTPALGVESAATRMAGLTGLITQSQSAGHAHPATQAVAVSLHKAAAQGENRTLILEMDPPELGRVEVRLAFGRDKTVKATVISEKPETYMMLQRDAHALGRALENAGLDGGGLSFELAGHGQDFSDGNSRGGGHDAGGNGAGGSDGAAEAIDTTMTWHVDPATGYMRYDILA